MSIKKPISSPAYTFLIKICLPSMAIFAIGIVVYGCWHGPNGQPIPAPLAVRIGILPFAAFYTFIFLSLASSVKNASMDDTNLYLSDYIREIAVPYSNIEDVRRNISYAQGAWGTYNIAIEFRQPTAFGKKIYIWPNNDSVFPHICVKINKIFVPHSDVQVGHKTLFNAIFVAIYIKGLSLTGKLPASLQTLAIGLFFLLYFLLFFVLIFGPLWAFKAYVPMHIFESFIYSAAILYPFVALLLLVKFKSDSPTSPTVSKASAGRRTLKFLLSLLLLFELIGVFYGVNVILDRSQAMPTAASVISKTGFECVHSRSGNSDCVEFVLPRPSPLPFTIMNMEDIELHHDDYKKAIPGQSTLTLFVHDGFLGLPWYEDRYVIANGIDLKQ